jgi:hypothetical protein
MTTTTRLRRTRCAVCRRRRLCHEARDVGLVVQLCDDCVFDLHHDLPTDRSNLT